MQHVQKHYVDGVEGVHITTGAKVDLVLEYDRITPQIESRYGKLEQQLNSAGGSLKLHPSGTDIGKKRKKLADKPKAVAKSARDYPSARRVVPDVSAETDSSD
jgi:hypothetical protein